MNNVERDEERIKDHLKIIQWLPGDCEPFSPRFFSLRWYYLHEFKDISEEFHRKYCGFYTIDSWELLAETQTCLSDQFYDDFFESMDSEVLWRLILNKRVSIEWIQKNSYRIPQEVWEKVYGE